MLRAMIDMDHLPFLALFLAGIAFASVLGAYLVARSRSRLPAGRLALMLCPAAVFITLALTSIKVVQTLDNDWNAARLAPAVALLSGSRLYVGPDGPGAVLHTIYPPLAYLVYLPAGLFSRATTAIVAGSCISRRALFRAGDRPEFPAPERRVGRSISAHGHREPARVLPGRARSRNP